VKGHTRDHTRGHPKEGILKNKKEKEIRSIPTKKVVGEEP